MNPEAFYKPSGAFGAGAILIPVILVPVTFIIGILYGYVDVYIPIGGYITFIITIVAGIAAGLVNVALLKKLKVRNRPLWWGTGIISGLLLLYFSWVAFGYALLRRGDAEIEFVTFLLRPDVVWGFAGAIMEAHLAAIQADVALAGAK